MLRRIRRTRRGSADSKDHDNIVDGAGGSTESCSNFARLDEGSNVSVPRIATVDSKASHVEVARIRTRSLPIPKASIEAADTNEYLADATSSSVSGQRAKTQTRDEGVEVSNSSSNAFSGSFLDRSRTQQSSIATRSSTISSLKQQQPSVNAPQVSDDKGSIESSTSAMVQQESAMGLSRTHQSSVTFADSCKQASASRDDDAPRSIRTGASTATSSVNKATDLGRSTSTSFVSSESNLFRTQQSSTSTSDVTGTATGVSMLSGLQIPSFSSILKTMTGNSLQRHDTTPVELTRQAAYEPPTISGTATSEATVEALKSPLSPSSGGIEVSPVSYWKTVAVNSRSEQDEVYLARKTAFEPPFVNNGMSSESHGHSKSTHSSLGSQSAALSPSSKVDSENVYIDSSGIVNIDSSKDSGGDDIPSKVPLSDGWFGRILSFNIGPYILVVVFLAIFGGFLYSAAKEYGYNLHWVNIFQKIDWNEELNVAFIGTAFLFVNDISRVMESISDYRIHQMSVIHPGGSLGSLLATGNGMYKVWQTQEADIGDGYYENYGGYRSMYDFGACSVAQLLQGYDEYMDGGNSYGVYYDDGLNPCLQDYIYENYVAAKLLNESFKWDFVVLADQTKRMAIELARNDTVTVLADNYAPFLLGSGATPVVVGPHAFMSSKTNMTGLGTIPAFTALIHEGVDAYVDSLANELPQSQSPVVCPVHLGFLLVWEEDYDFWQTLFVRDMMHSSLRGTYLFANILYATLFGHMPDADVSMPEYFDSLFADARKITGQYNSDLSREDAGYLRNIARRVVLNGEVPTSLDTYLY